jgi:hypothetical protein
MTLPYSARWTGDQTAYVVFTRGNNQVMWARAWTGGVWGPWQELGGGFITNEPSITANDNSVHAVARLASGELGHWHYQDGRFSFENLGGGIPVF